MVILPEDSWASGVVLWSCGRCQRESQLCGTWTPPLASSSPPSHPSPDPLWAPAQQSSSCHRSPVPPPATAGTAHYGSRLHRFRSKRIKVNSKETYLNWSFSQASWFVGQVLSWPVEHYYHSMNFYCSSDFTKHKYSSATFCVCSTHLELFKIKPSRSPNAKRINT